MKEQDPFNPAMPADFKLLTEGAAIDHGQSPPGITTEFTAGPEKTKRKSSRSAKQAAGSRSKKPRLRDDTAVVEEFVSA